MQLPRETQGHVCFSNTKNLSYPRRNGFSTDRPVLPIVTQKKRSHTWSIWLHPKWFSMSQISLQIKTEQRFTLEWTSTWIWGWSWPGWSVLPPDRGMKITAWHWRKRCWLWLHNKIKSQQHFVVTSANRVTVFQASLKVVREEAGAQLFNKDNKHSASQGSKCLQDGGCYK